MKTHYIAADDSFVSVPLQQFSEETHGLVERLRQGGHVSSAEFYEEVAHRADEALAIQEATDEYGRGM